MLSLSEDLLFVWEPAYLVMSWHVPRLPKLGVRGWGWRARKILVKNSGSENFDFKEGCIMGRVKFLKGIQEIFGEHRKLHNCSVRN